MKYVHCSYVIIYTDNPIVTIGTILIYCQ